MNIENKLVWLYNILENFLEINEIHFRNMHLPYNKYLFFGGIEFNFLDIFLLSNNLDLIFLVFNISFNIIGKYNKQIAEEGKIFDINFKHN